MLNTTNHLLVLAVFLTLCILSFVHIFIFPLYEINPNMLIKTHGFLSDYEYLLCKDKLPYIKKISGVGGVKKYRQRSLAICPRDGIVTVYQGGRLGNQMFEYAGVWAVARRTGLSPYVPGCIRRRLDNVFENLSVPALNQIAHCPMKWQNALVRSLDQWIYQNQSILLYRYYQELDVIIPWLQEIRQEFKIKQKLAKYAQQILIEALTDIKLNKQCSKYIFVGVHVRRTDIRSHLSRYQHTLVGAQYFYTAMNYFQKQFDCVIFVVVSDDPDWCILNLTQRANVFIASKRRATDSKQNRRSVYRLNTAEQDFAIMTACNHSIIDYGTFGVWGAILAGGETIVHNITGFTSTRVGEILPDWHLL